MSAGADRGGLAGPFPVSFATHGQLCPGCDKQLHIGTSMGWVLIGPGASEAARTLAADGKPYDGVCIPVHWACATGDDLLMAKGGEA